MQRGLALGDAAGRATPRCGVLRADALRVAALCRAFAGASRIGTASRSRISLPMYWRWRASAAGL